MHKACFSQHIRINALYLIDVQEQTCETEECLTLMTLNDCLHLTSGICFRTLLSSNKLYEICVRLNRRQSSSTCVAVLGTVLPTSLPATFWLEPPLSLVLPVDTLFSDEQNLQNWKPQIQIS